MAYYVGTEPELVRQGILPYSTTNVSSISTNFYSNIVVLGYQNEDVNRGCIEIHRYNPDNDTWFDKIKIDGPYQNSYFGKSVDMDWDGERIVVGANTAANVYIYDWDGGQFQNYSNIIEGPGAPGSEFGFSVSIAKNSPDVISIGSPGDNMMYVYQLENDTWTQRFSNSGVDINNLIPYSNVGQPVYDSSNNVVTNSEYNRYGEVVRMSSGGDYVIVSQPGTPLLNINTFNTTNFDIIDSQYHDEDAMIPPENPWDEPIYYDNVFVHTIHPFTRYENYNRQLGSVRVFKSDDASWGLSNTQVGNLVYGERNFSIDTGRSYFVNSNSPTGYSISWQVNGWGFPGFGLSCDITSDGKYIVVGAPLYGGDRTQEGHQGKVYTYELRDNIWVEINTVTHGFPASYQNLYGLLAPRYGLNVRLDYSGKRLVVNGSMYTNDTLGVYDFTETLWSPIQPIFLYRRHTGGTAPESVLETIDGKIVIMSRTDEFQNTILFTNNELTQFIYGNTLITGYVTAHDVYSRNKLGIGVTPSDTSGYYLKVKSPDGVQENIVEISSTTDNFSERSVSGIDFSGNFALTSAGNEFNDPVTSCRLVSGFSGDSVNDAYFSIRVPTFFGVYDEPQITLKDCITCANGGNVGIGTTNPTKALEVVGDSNFTGNVSIGTTNLSPKLDVRGIATIHDGESLVGTYEILNYTNDQDVTQSFFSKTRRVKIVFTLFDLEQDYDLLYVYTDANNPSPTYTFTNGTNKSPPAELTFDTGEYWKIKFTSDSYTTRSGFSFQYYELVQCLLETSGNIIIPQSKAYLGGMGIVQARRFNEGGTAVFTGSVKNLTPFQLTLTTQMRNAKIVLNYVLNYEMDENNVFKVYRSNGVLVGSSQGTGLRGVAATAYDNDDNSTMSTTVIEIVDTVLGDPGQTITYNLFCEGQASTFALNRTLNTSVADDLGGYRETAISTYGYYEISEF